MGTITNTVRWADNTKDLARNLKEGLNQIEATKAGAEKMAQSLSGDKLITAAHRLAAGIQEIGGATKLGIAAGTSWLLLRYHEQHPIIVNVAAAVMNAVLISVVLHNERHVRGRLPN